MVMPTPKLNELGSDAAIVAQLTTLVELKKERHATADKLRGVRNHLEVMRHSRRVSVVQKLRWQEAELIESLAGIDAQIKSIAPEPREVFFVGVTSKAPISLPAYFNENIPYETEEAALRVADALLAQVKGAIVFVFTDELVPESEASY